MQFKEGKHNLCEVCPEHSENNYMQPDTGVRQK